MERWAMITDNYSSFHLLSASIITHQSFFIPHLHRPSHGLHTSAGAVVFSPFSQQLPRKFGRYGFVIELLPGGSVPTLAGPLIRASTRSRACSIWRRSASTFHPTSLPFQNTTLPAIITSRT